MLRRSKQIKQEIRNSTNGWWYARFCIKWPKNIAIPFWYIDLLLAHKIISPILYEQKNNLPLWRFHRRAVRDQTGHQFSFIFYSSTETARQIYNSLKSDALLKEMKDTGIILQDIYDDPSEISKLNIEDTSDSNWSPIIQKSWPYFIMGVCQMWLNLITEIAEHASTEQRTLSFPEILDFYKQVNNTIKQLWQKEGCHSFLHHLNAIFGYEPIIVPEARLMKF